MQTIFGILLLLFGVFMIFIALNIVAEKVAKLIRDYYTPFSWWHAIIIGLLGDTLAVFGWYMMK